jgi:predicted DNA-binding antitoxin AbrB/MazE fold protein
MSITIEAKFEDGVLKPLVPVALDEGARVRVTIDAPTFGGAVGASDPIEDVLGIGAGDGPTDGSTQHDRYIYGNSERALR